MLINILAIKRRASASPPFIVLITWQILKEVKVNGFIMG